MRELKERRTKIVVHGVVRDLSSIDERFMVGIQSLVDRAESERIKERMQRGRREKARRGLKTGGPSPYGYRNPHPGEAKRGTLQVIPEEAAVIRRVFALAASGKGDRAVAVELNRLGLPAPRGGAWGNSSVRKVLQNVAYLGTSASGVWVPETRGGRNFRLRLDHADAIIREGAHEPIIDRAVWDAVHGRPRLPRTPVPRVLTDLLWVNGRRYGCDSGRGGAFYRARGQRGCPWLAVGDTDGAVWDRFASLATSPEFVGRLLAEAQKSKDQHLIRADIEMLEAKADKARKRLDRLVTMRADGEIGKEQYLSRAGETRNELAALEGELAGLRARVVSADAGYAQRVVRAVQTLLAGRTRLTVAQKRSVLQSIVRRVDVQAEATGARQRRTGGGGYGASGGPPWRIASVSFRLALPREEAGDAGGCRGGQLGTTAFGCGQAPDTGTAKTSDSSENGGWQLPTTD
jgi:hypothetical protein